MATSRRPRRTWVRVVWDETQRLVVLIIGAFAAAVGYAIFQVPYDIAASGISAGLIYAAGATMKALSARSIPTHLSPLESHRSC